jgi:pyruvate formate lyase activating enzyme
MTALQKKLDEMTRPGVLFKSLDRKMVRCYACAHRCLLDQGQRGICKMRFNRNGIIQVPWGYVSSVQIDPIEKKPFAHFMPGSDVLTFGMLGCNFHCDFCQNWQTSQTLRDPMAEIPIDVLQKVTPEQLVKYAVYNGVQLIASSYNEPLITTEWAVDIFKQAKKEGLLCAYVSNGYATPDALMYLLPYLSALKVDLKSMQEHNYADMGGNLQNVLDTIKLAHELGIWVEVVTLVIPGFNDQPDELWKTSRFLTSISPNIPWHVTAFHPDYHMLDREPTMVPLLQKAAEIGQEAGLNHVYAGNLPGRVGSLEDTHCPSCNTLLVKRRGFSILEYKITSKGKCPQCGTQIAGIWTQKPETVPIGNWNNPHRVRF